MYIQDTRSTWVMNHMLSSCLLAFLPGALGGLNECAIAARLPKMNSGVLLISMHPTIHSVQAGFGNFVMKTRISWSAIPRDSLYM